MSGTPFSMSPGADTVEYVKPPLRLRFALEDLPLAASSAVSVRVLRLGMECSCRFGGGLWAMALPVAVIDVRAGRRQVRPVVDVTLVALLAAAAVSLLAGHFGRRRHDGG